MSHVKECSAVWNTILIVPVFYCCVCVCMQGVQESDLVQGECVKVVHSCISKTNENASNNKVATYCSVYDKESNLPGHFKHL